MKKLYKTALGYEKWRKKNGGNEKPWLNPELNTLPMLDKADLVSEVIDDDDSFEEIEEDELDETNVEQVKQASDDSD